MISKLLKCPLDFRSIAHILFILMSRGVWIFKIYPVFIDPFQSFEIDPARVEASNGVKERWKDFVRPITFIYRRGMMGRVDDEYPSKIIPVCKVYGVFEEMILGIEVFSRNCLRLYGLLHVENRLTQGN